MSLKERITTRLYQAGSCLTRKVDEKWNQLYAGFILVSAFSLISGMILYECLYNAREWSKPAYQTRGPRDALEHYFVGTGAPHYQENSWNSWARRNKHLNLAQVLQQNEIIQGQRKELSDLGLLDETGKPKTNDQDLDLRLKEAEAYTLAGNAILDRTNTQRNYPQACSNLNRASFQFNRTIIRYQRILAEERRK